MPLELAVRRLGGAHARDDNDVVPRGHLFAVQAINLPQAAAYAVAHDGMAELGADRHAETRLADNLNVGKSSTTSPTIGVSVSIQSSISSTVT